MFKHPLSLAVTVMGLTALGWAVACSSSNGGSSGSSTSGSGGTSGGGSGSSGGSSGNASGSSGAGGSSGTADAGPSTVLIDDMSGTAGAQIRLQPQAAGDVAGYWYTYDNPVGVVTPPPQDEITDGGSASFTYSPAPTPLPADAGAIANAACVKGTTASAQYSVAAEGFNFQTTLADAGATPVAYNASSHTGIQFWLWVDPVTGVPMGGAPGGISVQLPDKDTSPYGGVCGLDAAPANECNSHFKQDLTPTSTPPLVTGWQFVQVAFALLTQNQYFGFQAPSAMFNSQAVYAVNFQVQQSNAPDAGADGGGPLPFNFCVADISFY
jgi:hypothetical protein